ncbi:DUF222 domain-containing protein [Nocardioides sp. AE5]|uniref:HNH endonuclease signature motif containing protein n=1 Tax=Nocardioides sp. AE5 TaxID=2962573 RepID=UPI002882C776|nr:DUF222 domain-containing protein [Nocardioides sp. AE5]MDT0201644.1 DUF222 domain-containing protein [Nocardioides sp. AE5]
MVKDSGVRDGGSGGGAGSAISGAPDAYDATHEHRLLACVAAMRDALAEAATINPTLAPCGVKREALLGLSRLGDQVEALRMTIMATADDVRDADAARSIADWLAAHTNTDRGPQAAASNLAHDLDRLYPTTAAALSTGQANLAQVRVITRCLNELRRLEDVTPGILAQAETALLGHCAKLSPRELRVLGDRILEVIDPELFEEAERKKLERDLARARAQARLSMRRRGDGATDLTARIPDAHATRLKNILNAFTAPRHDANDNGSPSGTSNGGLAENAVGSRYRDPATGERLPQDRLLGEAFCAFLERHDPTLVPQHGGTATTLVITTQYDALTQQLMTGTLPDGTRVPATEIRRLACTAGIIPAVLGSDSVPLDLGRKTRLFTPEQRIALRLRHSTCQAQDCTIPARWCEAHHRTPWSHGGPTDLDHGMLLCAYHHQRIHDPAYTTQHEAGGDVRFHRRP